MSAASGSAKKPPRRLGWRVVVAILVVEIAIAYLGLATYQTFSGEGLINGAGNPIGGDFVQYYAASRVALEGDPAAVYDLDTLHEMERRVVDSDIGQWPWAYPPPFLLVVMPFAKLPYLAALAAWLAVTLLAYLAVIRKIAPHPSAPWLALLFPITTDTLFSGQNGLLSAALIGGALLTLERRPVIAGVLFGLLSYKPHLGLLIPLALIAAGNWRAFLAAASTVLVMAALSLAALGAESWAAFLAHLPEARAMIESGGSAWSKMPTPFAVTRLGGGGIVTAWIVQAAVSAAMAATVIWTWRQPLPPWHRACVLVPAMILATPYAQFYDMAMLALPIAWMAWAGYREGWMTGERKTLTILWIAPIAAWLFAHYLNTNLWWLFPLAILVLALRRAAAGRPAER